MAYYDSKFYFDTLTFLDIFPDEESFIEQVVSVGGNTEDLPELYEILLNKYAYAKTRYTQPMPFILAIRRELQVEFPSYLVQKELLEAMRDIEIEEVRRGTKSIRNIINNPNNPTDNPSEEVIPDLSSMQESLFMSTNKLDAIKTKYNALFRNYLIGIYRAVDNLFVTILSDDTTWVYGEDE